MPLPEVKYARTDTLEIAYEESGSRGAEPIFLLHGFPYDPRAYDGMVPRLVEAGYRTIVPYLRGYGPTRFLKAETPRSGQQAALAHDLLALMDALKIDRAAHVGYDWGGRAACILAALSPRRVRGLVSQGGYNIHDIPGSVVPVAPEQEHRFWYQYYFHTERGRAGLAKNRREFCQLLWRLWSPHWQFDAETFERTAKSFDNPDFVDVVIQSYRHRYAYAAGDPALEAIEQQLIAHRRLPSRPSCCMARPTAFNRSLTRCAMHQNSPASTSEEPSRAPAITCHRRFRNSCARPRLICWRRLKPRQRLEARGALHRQGQPRASGGHAAGKAMATSAASAMPMRVPGGRDDAAS